MMKEKTDDKTKRAPTASFMMGVVALVFCAVGYQTALFIHSTAIERVMADRDHPDTVFVYDAEDRLASRTSPSSQKHGNYSRTADNSRPEAGSRYSSKGRVVSGSSGYNDNGDRVLETGQGHPMNSAEDEAGEGRICRDGQDGSENAGGRESRGDFTSGNGRQVRSTSYRKNASHSDEVMAMRAANPPRPAQLFDFDPNSASLDDFIRLGFSPKQAASIINYRNKGGAYRRKEDFARSFVVSEEMYGRLEPIICIPKLDLNVADSAELDALPGIGPYFVKKILDYRRELHGYSDIRQLLEIYHFDEEKFDSLKDLVTVGRAPAYPLWTLPADSLRKHPYIGTYSAKGIVLYRQHHPKTEWTVEGLAAAGVLRPENVPKLQRCALAAP